MEFPSLGTHCAETTCSRLDFLPFECDACHKIFCKDHQTYDQHHCTEMYSKDVQVPICPMCNQPVPVNRGEDPNRKMDQHIHGACQSDKAKKLYTNKCSFVNCKKKELVPVSCTTCQKNFCFKHRFETDHNCQGHPNRLGGVAKKHDTGAARKNPQSTTNRKPQTTALSAIGADLNRERLLRLEQQRKGQFHSAQASTHTTIKEDEALAAAIAASMNDSAAGPSSVVSSPPKGQSVEVTIQQCDEDEALAQAIAASLQQEDMVKSKHSKPKQADRPRQQTNDCRIA